MLFLFVLIHSLLKSKFLWTHGTVRWFFRLCAVSPQPGNPSCRRTRENDHDSPNYLPSNTHTHLPESSAATTHSLGDARWWRVRGKTKGGRTGNRGESVEKSTEREKQTSGIEKQRQKAGGRAGCEARQRYTSLLHTIVRVECLLP